MILNGVIAFILRYFYRIR